jgi:ribonuclease HII
MTDLEESNPIKVKRIRIKQEPLLHYYSNDEQIIEIGIDEVGRGPLFGRVYTAAVILPKDDSFDHFKMKDSKKFHSKQKLIDTAEYIKQNALYYSISYKDEKVVDEINILQATQQCMHQSIDDILHQLYVSVHKNNSDQNIHCQNIHCQNTSNIKLLVDGNYFNSYVRYNNSKKMLESIEHICVEGGDNKYTVIAAASILAKVARDTYIEELCISNPTLSEYYNIDQNKGYGAQKHIEGIKIHGITEWHRRSFGICKKY